MRIVQLADLHFGAENIAAIHAASTRIDEMNPDLVVVSGDMTQRGKHSEFRAARKWVDALCRPTLIVPGNHDTPLLNMVSRASGPFQRHDSYFDAHAAPLRFGNVRVDGLNTARGWQARSNWAEGSVRLSQLESIASHQVAEGTVRLLACHHPFRSPSGAAMRTRTRRGERASERLAESNISVLLTGHVHTPHAELIRENTGTYLAVTAGTLSTRTRAAPAAFNCIHVSAGAVAVDALDFDGLAYASRPLGRWKLSEFRNAVSRA
ncbi:metallophosphoesterase family protein [Hyphomonas johnsonii]|uniref:Ser/Thr protein phosphatase family protein n=1 Tax=Hyphomonas johnsonii MHS-2 TaxID=1280950 RepID=A0A059FTA4_9PROT|nr:metallophosphoesterase [Hyphomonas johnsonii]KCZ93910.1 Ser/Thr protein phosphatase family protein [Hyphomonas johnsonii MHS-2]